jgi:hypothetical protein
MIRRVTLGIGSFLVLMSIVRAQPLQTEHDSCITHENIPIPRYHIERTVKIDNGRGLLVFVSVQPSTIDRREFIAVGCALGKRFATLDSLAAYIFTDRRAAKEYNPQGEGNSRAIIAAFRAVYRLARSTDVSGQALDLRTNPDSPYPNIEILLGAPPDSHFCSADPLAGEPDDPQSWNRYPYGRNDPIDKVDSSIQVGNSLSS